MSHRLSTLSHCLLLSLLGSCVAHADVLENEPHADLGELSITATRIPSKINNIIAETTIINSDTLQSYQGKSVLDVLRTQPNLTITQSGGLGTASNFYLRGHDSKNVLVIIDGVRYSSLTTGQPAVNLLPAEQIERIEILHGASGAAIYGADAVGGVIQIFTKKNSFDGSKASLTVGAGSHNQLFAAANTHFSNNNTQIGIGLSHNKTDGFDAIVPNTLNHHPDDDGFKATNASFTINHHLNDNLNIGAQALYSESTTDIDGSAGEDWSSFPPIIYPALDYAYAKQKNGAASAYIEHHNSLAATRLSYGRSIDKSSTFDNTQSQSIGGARFDTTQDHARLESRIKVSDNTHMIAGIEHLKQQIDSTQTYEIGANNPIDKRSISSGFIGYQVVGQYVDAQGNFRLDDNSQYGRQSNYNIGFAIKPITGVRLGANHATSFRAPTFNELYWPNSGNVNLKPETSENTEIFAEYSTALQRSRMTAYRSDIDNLIAGWPAQNINAARIKGISATSDWHFDSGALLGASYSYQEPKNLSQRDADGNPYDLTNRPRYTVKGYLGYQHSNFDVKAEIEQVGKRYINTTNTTALDKYTLINLIGGYQLSPNVRFDARINNLTDEEYTLTEQFGTRYATDGRNYFGSVTFSY